MPVNTALYKTEALSLRNSVLFKEKCVCDLLQQKGSSKTVRKLALCLRDINSIFQDCLLHEHPQKYSWEQRAISAFLTRHTRNVRDSWKIFFQQYDLWDIIKRQCYGLISEFQL